MKTRKISQKVLNKLVKAQIGSQKFQKAHKNIEKAFNNRNG